MVVEPKAGAAGGTRRGLVLLFCDVLEQDERVLDEPKIGAAADPREKRVPHFCVTVLAANPVLAADVGTVCCRSLQSIGALPSNDIPTP